MGVPPMINESTVCRFLQHRFEQPVQAVSILAPGWYSQAFFFQVGKDRFVFRINRFEEDFKKDTLAYHLFSGQVAVPIPQVVDMGRFDEERWFAISEFYEGERLRFLPGQAETTVRYVTRNLFHKLDAIRQADISKFVGWGRIDADGRGRFSDWRSCLTAFYSAKVTLDWPDLFRRTLMERDVYRRVIDSIGELLPYCPEEKYLVHGDFGIDNVLFKGERVTAVLDWAEFRIGDFLYDLAILDFWSDGIAYAIAWRLHADQKGYDVPHFEQRVQCYLLHHGLTMLAMTAYHGNKERYYSIRERIGSVLNGSWKLAEDGLWRRANTGNNGA